MIRAFVAAMFIACFAVPALADAPPAIRKIQEQTFLPTAKLSNNCSAQIIYSARDAKTGKVETLVLTAKHCVAQDKTDTTKTVDVASYDNRLIAVKITSYLADTIGKSIETDVALLRLRDHDTLFANVAKLESAATPLFMGEDVIAVGYPRALALTMTRGALGPVERIDVSGTEHGYFRSSTDVAPGSSGGGLYHLDAAGDWRLIGIATAVFPDAPFMSCFTTIDDIEVYLKSVAPQIYAVLGSKCTKSGC